MLTFKQFINEGNYLARIHGQLKKGHTLVALSGARPGMSKKEERAATKRVGDVLRAHGYGYKKTTGDYEGTREPSIVAFAPRGHHERIKRIAKKAAAETNPSDPQDSILVKRGKRGKAKLVGTGKADWLPPDTEQEVGGSVLYNNKSSPFQTHVKPVPNKGRKLKKGRTPKGVARFTTGN